MLDYDEFEIPRELDILEKISREIQGEIIKKGQYFVKSKVRKDIFQMFLDLWLKNKKPSVDLNNIYELYLLNKEFDLKSDYNISDFDELLKISMLKSTQLTKHDRSESEMYISTYLDFYLNNYQNQMYQIPPTSLYNIFYNKKRNLNDQNLGYTFLTHFDYIKPDENKYLYLYTLLESLDAKEMKKENVQHSIINRDIHFGFTVKNVLLFYDLLIEENQQNIMKIHKQEKIIQQLKQKISDKEKILHTNIFNILHAKIKAFFEYFLNAIKNFFVSITFLFIILALLLILFLIFKNKIIARYYKFYADRDDIDAIIKFAGFLYQGFGVSQNKTKSTLYYKRAANKGNVDSMIIYARMMYYDTDISKNKTESLKYYKLAADAGSVGSMINYSKIIYDIDKKESAKYLKMASDKGDVNSTFEYAEMLYSEEEVGINKPKGALFYKMAADKGHVKAMYKYANMLQKGDYISINKTKALQYYKNAAHNGDVSSMLICISILTESNGELANKTEAVEYYKMAADHGDVDSMFSYAEIFYYGKDGFQCDYKIAVSYYKKAADNGHEIAMYQYALMKENGFGTTESKIVAKHYYKKSFENGYNIAQDRYLTLENEKPDLFPVIFSLILVYYAIRLICDCCC